MAGCYDRTWRVGSQARGTRSQFRLSPQGLLPFKCTYPVHLTDVMDIGQPSQTGLLTAGDLVSPNKVTRTRTVREYEQTISELKKENFDLKLRIFLLEEAINKNSRKDKECSNEDKDNTVQVIVQLKVETESLRNELSYKNKLLEDSLDQAEKYSSELKELQAEYSRLQEQLSTLSECPPKTEFMLLQDEKENLLKENEFLTNELSAKNNEIQEINSKVEELSSRNRHLEEKVKKSCIAIQGVVHKYYKETELFPKAIRPIIHSAVQAAKNNDQEDLVLSLKRFKATLCEIMPTSVDQFDSVFKENEVNKHSKQSLEESTFQHKEKEKIRKDRVLNHPSESHVELSHIQDLKKMFPGNGCSSKEHELSFMPSEQFSSCEVMLSDSGKSITSVGDNCLVDVFICSDIHKSIEEQQIPEVQLSDLTLNHPVSCIKNSTMISEVFLPSEISIETLNGNRSSLGKIIDPVPIKYQNIRDVSNNEKEKELLLQLSSVLKENESLKSDIDDKLSTINDLTSTYNELEQKTIQLQSELHDTMSKLKQLEIKSAEEKDKAFGCLLKTNKCTQTSAADLLAHSKTEKSVERIGQSNNIAELKEEILVLLLTIEEKDKELADLKQEITSLQTELENALNKKDVTFSNMDPEYLNERNELRERLALSCSVNNELIKHLQNLEAFMEDLLHQRNLDVSSLENISETSDFISQLSRCLDESLKLSHALSDHLSICEASKLFEAGEISETQDISVHDSKSSQFLGLSKLSSNVTDPYFKFDEGRNKFVKYNKEFYKIAAGTGKRRWSYSTHHKNAVGQYLHDPDNMVVLGTSNNEDLILLLNENGDPADVLIRNNHTHLSESKLQTSLFQSGNQLRRRCWEDNSTVPNMSHCEKQGINYNSENVNNTEFRSTKQTHSYYNHYISSDSDIWSEPDRDVSMQRIGIDVKNSPVTPKSPRKLRGKEKRISDEFSSEKNTSNYGLSRIQTWSRRRRNSGSTSKRLFARENSITQDYKLEKHYSLLAEKFPKLTSMLNQLEKVKDANSDMVVLGDIYEELNVITSSVSETLHKLTAIKENAKKLTPIICEKCAVLELLLKLEKVRRRIQYSEILQYVSGTNAEPLVHSLLTEVDSLKKQLEEPHAVLSSGANTSESENEIVKNEDIGNIADRKSISESEHKELKDLKLKTELLEKELNEMKEICEEDKRLLESLKTENHALSNHLNNLKQEILDLEENKKILTSENSGFIQRLTEVNKKNSSLNDFIKELEQKAANSNIAYNQLKGDLEKTREQLEKLDVKCLQYEEEISAQSKEKNEFVEKIKTIENEVQTEKEKHIKETEKLISEKHDLLRNLELEKEKSEFLEEEKNNLNAILKMNNREIESLRTLNQELETAKQNLLSERDNLKCNLLSNTSLCDELKSDLKKMRESLQDMELKCAKYEQKFEESSNSKSYLINKLSAIKRGFVSKIGKLEKFHRGKEESSFLNEPSDITPIIDKDKCIENLCDELASESNRFFEITDNLMKEWKDINLHHQEYKGAKENLQIKISAMQKKIELQETEIKHLMQQKEHLQIIVDEQKKCISDKEKSLRLSDNQIQSLSIQLSNLQTEMDQDKFKLNQKDDEITTLQERIFNLNTEINNLKAEKCNLEATNNEFLKFRNEKSKDNTNIGSVLTSIGVKSSDDTNLKQESEVNVSEIYDKVTDTSTDSLLEKNDKSNLISFENKESYNKKIKALKTKLSMTEKRIEILEKEKKDLRDSVLEQVRNDKKIKALMEDKEDLNEQVLNLKSNVEKKATFIRELKNDLFATYNSLVDITQEVNNLKEELSKYKENSKLNSQTEQKNFENNLIISPQSVNDNIQNLKKHKWELIQAIFSLQRKFYEKKGIHLDHFDKFKKHIEDLYSFHFSSTLCKSESEPLLHIISEGYSGQDRTLKSILEGLKFDIECLENLGIFLKRFFIPFVLHNSHMPISKFDKDDSSPHVPKASLKSNEENYSELLKQSMMNGKITEESSKDTFKSIEVLRIGSDDYMSPFHRNKWDKLIWNVSCQLDCIENSLITLQSEHEYFKQIESSIGESPCKSQEKSLLSEIFCESKLLHQKASQIISLNSTLKSTSVFTRNISKVASKQDMSDRESLLSEETITLSRSESLSPISFEEAFPVRIISIEQNVQKELEGNALQKMSIESKNVVNELFPDRLETVGSSQDSVFHRSHYSSPDLGIESDPNHESSAPEQMEKEDCKTLSKHPSEIKVKQKLVGKPLQKLIAPPVESRGEVKGNEPYFVTGGVLHAIGILQDYELLKKEIKEGLVGIKSVLSRTGDGLHHIAKCTSPRKKLEYSTFKAIKETCAYVEVCLKEAYRLVCNFWTAPHPCVEEWTALIQENQELYKKLDKLKNALEEKENDFRKAMDNIEAAKLEKEKMDLKITKKLVKTKNIIKRAEKKLIENTSQNLLHVPKYPSEDYNCQGKL